MSMGSLLDSTPIDTAIAGARAWRVRHSTVDVNGAAHEATGLVVAPAATGADRPLLTHCHGTTGLGDAACPSALPDPARELTVYFSAESAQQIDFGIPGLQGFIDAGWVVCATDYQGLGTPGMHQYEVNRSNALDAVAIARAAASLPVGAGTRLGCMGWSQGGGAAAAVAELEPDDFGGLTLIGSVPMSPGILSISLDHPTGLAASLHDPTIPPDSHVVMAFSGFAAAYPHLDLGDILTPLGRSIVDSAWNTQPVHHLNDTLARLFRLKGAILRTDPANMDTWVDAIRHGSAGRVKPRVPILMCQDSFDGGTVVPVPWQQAYADAVRALGGTIDIRDYPEADHFSLPTACVADARAWLERLL